LHAVVYSPDKKTLLKDSQKFSFLNGVGNVNILTF